MTRQELEKLTRSRLDALHRELGGRVSPDEVRSVGTRHFERLCRQASIFDYVPLLVYRSTKDELLLGVPERLQDVA